MSKAFHVEEGDFDAHGNRMWEVRDRAGVFESEHRSKREAQAWAKQRNAEQR